MLSALSFGLSAYVIPHGTVIRQRLRDFDSSQLGVTVPKLHDMKNAMRQLLDAVRADICFRT